MIRGGLTQDTQQSGGPAGQVLDDSLDVGMGGADGYPEADGDLREGVVPAQVDQTPESTLVGRQLAAAVTPGTATSAKSVGGVGVPPTRLAGTLSTTSIA